MSKDVYMEQYCNNWWSDNQYASDERFVSIAVVLFSGETWDKLYQNLHLCKQKSVL